MRSLAAKLTLAFLAVGLIGLISFVIFGTLRARTEFDRFVSSRDQSVLVNALIEHYEKTGSWNGVGQALASRLPLGFYARSAILVDNNGTVVMGSPRAWVGRTLPVEENDDGEQIIVNEHVVGHVFFRPIGQAPQVPAESAFISRIAYSALFSAGIATAIALVIGGLLARTLTQPIRELTAATRAMAAGQLNQRVRVRGNDELGRLAQSFNQMSADLARNLASRKQMTADLAHDLRTPLSILRGYIEGLMEGRVQGDPQLFATMNGEVEHLQSLVDDLRTLSLADAGELALNRRKIAPAVLLEKTALAYYMRAESQHVVLRVDASPDLPDINVDTVRMTQVLNNLVNNALRFTHAGQVVLAARRSGEKKVSLSVSDTGAGIPSEQVPFVFDRFYRGDASRTRANAESSGLGLAIAKAIVEAHGGSIGVTSVAGKGSVFEMALLSG